MTSPHMYTVLMRRLSLIIDPYMTNSNEIESSLSTVLLYIYPHGRCPITVHQHYMEDSLCHVLLIPNMYFCWYAPTRTYSILIRSWQDVHVYVCMPHTALTHTHIQGVTHIQSIYKNVYVCMYTMYIIYSHNTIILCDVAARPAVEGGPNVMWPAVGTCVGHYCDVLSDQYSVGVHLSI